MTRFTIRTLLKNKVLWAWPGVFLLFIIAVFIWGDVTSAQNSYSFIVKFDDVPVPSGIIMSQLISLTTLIFIIGFPTHLSENIKSERAALLLSKPVSRSEMFFSDFGAVLSVSFLYTVVSIFLLATLTIGQAGIFPIQYFATVLFLLPLYLLAYYTTIVLLLLVTNSYLGGVLLGYFVTGFSSLFLNSEQFLSLFGLTDTFAETVVSFLSYIVPSSGGIQQLMEQIFQGGISNFDGGLFAFALITFLPFFALSYFVLKRKEF